MASTKEMQMRAKNKKKNSLLSFKSVYHYTKGIHISKILDCGYIALENSIANIKDEKLASLMKRRNFVWFTESEVYPKTAMPFIPSVPSSYLMSHFDAVKPKVDFENLAKAVGGLFRFKFVASDERIIKWLNSNYRKINHNNYIIKALEESANLVGDGVNNFWISENKVKLINCDLEILIDGKWSSVCFFDSNGQIHQKCGYSTDYFISQSICKRVELGLI